jgi:hypothetical protein
LRVLEKKIEKPTRNPLKHMRPRAWKTAAHANRIKAEIEVAPKPSEIKTIEDESICSDARKRRATERNQTPTGQPPTVAGIGGTTLQQQHRRKMQEK